MPSQLRDKIADRIAKPARTKLDVPDWDFDVYARKIGADEQVGMEALTRNINDVSLDEKLTILAKLCTMLLVDQDGNRVFAESDEDVEMMRKNPFETLDAIWKQSAAFNKMTPEVQKEMAESFDGRQGAGSPTA